MTQHAMRNGILLPRDLAADGLIPFAVQAETSGFDELWVVEDLGFRGGIAQAAVALALTAHLRVGIGILPAAVRNVAYAAMEVATLAQLFPGRVNVGVGHGMPDWLKAAGTWPERPLAYLRAYVLALQGLLRGETVAWGSGELALDPAAVPAVVPDVLLGVRGPKSLQASGRVAQGTILAEPSTEEYVTAAREQIAATGPHRIVAYNVAAVDDDGDAAVAAVRPGLEWIGEADWLPHLRPIDIGPEVTALRAQSATREEFARRLPPEWVARLAVAGTPAEVRERLAGLARAGVTTSVLIPAGPDPLAAVAALGRALPGR
ncbi:LLM class flavin-dependent oxidoreductase [Microbacterium sp. P05]|uniref:LLM class flavin-dependent oxidoreductase n=1 Tax=Microbacterium sp. P05 TaxID=3366948 RepID=UPI0037472765